MPALTAPRVGIVGVRRLRQGLGEHFARWLVAAGAEVPAFIGRTKESIAEGTLVLAKHGIHARGFTSLDELLAAQPLDALVIASPAHTHAEWLDRAYLAGLHVLCEKPLIPGAKWPNVSAPNVPMSFFAKRLLLREHCPWPETLPAYEKLHPGVLERPFRTFEMELAPTSRGVAMIEDAMSHPLSLLQAVRPHPISLRGVAFSTRDSMAERIDVSLDLVIFTQPYATEVAVTVRLRHVLEQPRPAAYAFDGHRAERRISLPGYSMSLADGDRLVSMEDPMKLFVERFVRDLATPSDLPVNPMRPFPVDLRPVSEPWQRCQLLAEIAAAFQARPSH